MADDDITASMDDPQPRRDVPHQQQIGSFRILDRIGEGGFGVVYEAEQTEPVRRRVALKVIKPGMDSAAVVARFEAERQALAVMEHPCIARIYDGGVTSPELGSRPYFVMELVRGMPITEHCDKQQLTIDERCKLFIKVCEAVQHAHTKGVIHRDLKPSNVLVAYDAEGKASPKIIDFGVAKALNTRLSERTIFTERGQLIGTPEYMSPEQAEMSGQNIDTRADVYSLGVLLYELLTGVLPFDPKTLRAAAFAEIQRIIREVDPPRPSTRLSTLLSSGDAADRANAIVRGRRADARELAGKLKQDLDWVVMRCIEKDRGRRYEGAAALADDLRRYVRMEPLAAGPPSLRYKAAKLVRRRRRVLVVCAVLCLGVAAGIAGLVGGRSVATEASSRAEVATQNIERLSGMIAEAERLAEQRSLGSERADRIDRQTRIDYAGRPSEELYFRSDEIRRLISDGDARLAELHAERVLDLVGTKTVVYNVQLVRALSGMAAALRAQGQLRQALACAEQMVTVSREIAVPLLIARAQYNKGRVLRSSHRPLEALVEYEAASAQMLQQVGSQDWTLLTAATGQVLVDLERSQEAVELLETALMSMPPATPVSDALPIRVELARAMTASGNEAEALQQIERVRTSGATFPPTWMSVLDEYEGQALMKLGQWDAAQSLLWSALLHQAEVSPTPGPASISMMVDIIECFTQLGWDDEARMMSVIVRSQADQLGNTKPEPSDAGAVFNRLLDRMDRILQAAAG